MSWSNLFHPYLKDVLFWQCRSIKKEGKRMTQNRRKGEKGALYGGMDLIYMSRICFPFKWAIHPSIPVIKTHLSSFCFLQTQYLFGFLNWQFRILFSTVFPFLTIIRIIELDLCPAFINSILNFLLIFFRLSSLHMFNLEIIYISRLICELLYKNKVYAIQFELLRIPLS